MLSASRLLLPIALTISMIIVPHQHLTQEAFAEEASMTANLEGLSLRDFILFVSRFTGRNMVFQEEQVPPVKVSLHSQAPMTEPELMAVLDRVLASNNLDLVAQGDLHYILQAPQASQILDPVRPPLDPGEEKELLTTVLQLDQRAIGKQVQELLQPFASRFGTILEIPQAKAVLLRDTRARVHKMQQVLQEVLALGPGWDVALFPLHEAQASVSAEKVSQLYAQLFDRGRIADTPVILPVEWSNMLLAAGSPDQLDMVRSLLESLDQVADATAGMSMFSLKNARASSAADVLRSLFQDGQKTVEDAAPVRRPVIAADAETNSVLVLADPQVQKQVESVIAHLDRPLDQVFVEALIVETSLEKSRDFGVEWIVGGGGADGLITGGFLADPSGLGPLITEPGPPISPGGFTLGALGNTITYAGKQFSTLGGLINFIKTATDFNILSTPQIMTLDNAEAEIFIGENLAYKVSEMYDANNKPIQSFEYRDVGIRLKVTPSINAETGMIRMEVEQEVKHIFDQETVKEARPRTINRMTRTNVQVPDGFTMVISGLMQDSLTQARRAVPGVSRVPAFGWLFRRERVSAPKTTLMVFVTARIINTMEQAEHLTTQRVDGLREAQEYRRQYLQREFWSGGVEEDFHFPEDFGTAPDP